MTGKSSHPSPLPLSQQTRLGELAALSTRIRKRMRVGRGECALSTAQRVIRAFPLPSAREGQGEGGF